MTDTLPPDVQQVLARSVAAWLRSAPNQQLPPRLRRFKGFRPKAVARHRAELLRVLEDDVVRRQMLEWLDSRHPLPRADADLLRLAVERPEGWAEALGTGSGQKSPTEETKVMRLEAVVEREKERARRAKDEAARAKEETRKAKEEARLTVLEERSKAVGLTEEVNRLERELASARRASREANAEASRAHRARERAERKARTSVGKAQAERDASAQALRGARREAKAARARAERLENELRAAGPTKSKKEAPTRAPKPTAPVHRTPLPVPKGRLEDDPETMREWLGVPGVVLLVDGYNVTKAEGGFGELSLELQRDRLMEAVNALQLKTKAKAMIVFDGSGMPPGIGRPRRRRVAVEYSHADETADDHIVALLEKLAPDPVVLATDDRELQRRAKALGATVATSGQLLALLR